MEVVLIVSLTESRIIWEMTSEHISWGLFCVSVGVGRPTCYGWLHFLVQSCSVKMEEES